MHRAIPVSNKLLSKKWDEMSQAVHHEKLRSMRALVDSATPVSFPHSAKKAKKEQLLEDRYTEIERENRLLLEKMSTIMQNHPSRERNSRKKSLNRESRKRELVKITMENQALLRRLQDRQPSYSIHKWEDERRRTERLLQNICEYPYQLGVTSYPEEGNTRRRFGSVESRVASRQEIGSAAVSRNGQAVRKPGSTTAGDRPRKLAPIVKDESREVVFKRGLNINEKYFLIEVSEKPGLLTITAFDIESPDSYNLEMNSKEAIELMGEEKAYDKLVSMLSFEKGELMLVDKRAEEVPKQQSSNKKPKVKPSPVSRKTPVHVESRTPETRGFEQNPEFSKPKESTPIPETKSDQMPLSSTIQKRPSDSKPEITENPTMENRESPSFPEIQNPNFPSVTTPKETIAVADEETTIRKSSENAGKQMEEISKNPTESKPIDPDVGQTYDSEAPVRVEPVISQAENEPKEESFPLRESVPVDDKAEIPHVQEPEISLETKPKTEEIHIEESAVPEVPNAESIPRDGDHEKADTFLVEEAAPLIEPVPTDLIPVTDSGHEVQPLDASPEIEKTDQIDVIPPDVIFEEEKKDQPILLQGQEKIDEIEVDHPQVLTEGIKDSEEKHVFEQVETAKKEEKSMTDIQSLKEELAEPVDVEQTYVPEQPSTERKMEESDDPKPTFSEEKKQEGEVESSPDPVCLNREGLHPMPDQVPERTPDQNPAEIQAPQISEIAPISPADASSPPKETPAGDVDIQNSANLDGLEAAEKEQSASE